MIMTYNITMNHMNGSPVLFPTIKDMSAESLLNEPPGVPWWSTGPVNASDSHDSAVHQLMSLKAGVSWWVMTVTQWWLRLLGTTWWLHGVTTGPQPIGKGTMGYPTKLFRIGFWWIHGLSHHYQVKLLPKRNQWFIKTWLFYITASGCIGSLLLVVDGGWI